MSLVQVLFLVFGALLAVSALSVVLNRNPVASALFLVLGFISLGGIYLTMQAEFLGLVQILVYAGAIDTTTASASLIARARAIVRAIPAPPRTSAANGAA